MRTATSWAHRVFSFTELRAAPMSRSVIAAQLQAGTLRRLRRDRYVFADVPEVVCEAVGYGGRLDCVSLLREMGVFVLAHEALHVQVTRHASRLPARPAGVRAHWRATAALRADGVAPLVEAVAQAIRCQPPRAAIATIDSLLHLRILTWEDLTGVFDQVPRRYRVLRKLVDGRSESGPESLVRVMLRQLGCDVRLQATLAGVGRVDLLVDGWLIIECDSRAYHSDWAQHREDRRRDRAAAELGYATLRLMAEDILYRPDAVAAALRGIVRGRRDRR